jgi:hypothetical protein
MSTSKAFSLQIRRRMEQPANEFVLVVRDEAKAEYYLQLDSINEKAPLVKAVLRAIAESWPNVEWEFSHKGSAVTAIP